MAQRIIDRSYVGEVLQHIYSSELSIHLALYFDGGYFKIRNEEIKSQLQGTTVEEAVTDLSTRLAKEYPRSEFATWWRMHFQSEETKGQTQ